MTPLTPALRLTLSRERLRLALQEPAHAQAALLPSLQGLIKRHPLAAALGIGLLGAGVMRLRPWHHLDARASWLSTVLPALLPLLAAGLSTQAWSDRLAAWGAANDRDDPGRTAASARSAAGSKKA